MVIQRKSKSDSIGKRLTPGINGDKGSYSRAPGICTSNKHAQERMTRSMRHRYEADVTAFLKTDLFLVSLFFCKRKAVPVQ